MKGFLFLSIIALASIFGTTAHSATITFRSDADLSVQIFKPIDGAYNSLVVSDVLNLKKNSAVDYNVNISEFGYVCCRLYDESLCDVLLLPNDHVELTYKNASPTFNGSNAAGQTYWHKDKGLVYYLGLIDSLVSHHITNRIDFESIDFDLKNKLLSNYSSDLQKMRSANKISKTFEDLLNKEFHYVQLSMLLNEYQNLLGGRVKKYKPTSTDSIEITKRILALYNDPNIINEKMLRFKFAHASYYYLLKWNSLSKENRSALRGNVPSSAFGSSMYYLVAPEYLQAILFGNELLEDLKYGEPRLDRKKLLEFLKEKYPTSEYIPIIQKKLE